MHVRACIYSSYPEAKWSRVTSGLFGPKATRFAWQSVIFQGPNLLIWIEKVSDTSSALRPTAAGVPGPASRNFWPKKKCQNRWKAVLDVFSSSQSLQIWTISIFSIVIWCRLFFQQIHPISGITSKFSCVFAISFVPPVCWCTSIHLLRERYIDMHGLRAHLHTYIWIDQCAISVWFKGCVPFLPINAILLPKGSSWSNSYRLNLEHQQCAQIPTRGAPSSLIMVILIPLKESLNSFDNICFCRQHARKTGRCYPCILSGQPNHLICQTDTPQAFSSSTQYFLSRQWTLSSLCSLPTVNGLTAPFSTALQNLRVSVQE